MNYSSTMRRIVSIAGLAVALSQLATERAEGQAPHDQIDSENELSTLLLLGGAAVATTPFWLPLVATQDENHQPGYFAEYPYQHDLPGNMRIGHAPAGEAYDWTFQAKTAYAENFSRFRRMDTAFQLEGTHRFGVDTEFSYWRESIESGQIHTFWTGDANLLFRFAQSEWLQARVGLGGNWLEDGANSDYGFNFTYKTDLFICNPWILSGELDWGTLGDETLFHPRITLGAQWHRAELFIGCDYFDIGSIQTTTMLLGGRFWY